MAPVATFELKSKITMKELGNPKAAAAFEPGDGKRHYLGRVLGFASGQIQKLDDQGEPLYGLKGTFRATPAPTEKVPSPKELRSGVCYLPGGIQEAVSEAIPDGDGRVGFAFDVYTEASSNKAGYSYVVTSLRPPEEEDPFSALGDLPELPVLAAPKK